MNQKSKAGPKSASKRRRPTMSRASRAIVAPRNSSFWRSKSVEALAAEQGVSAVDNPEQLRGDFWPRDESADDFLAWLRNLRHEGKGGT